MKRFTKFLSLLLNRSCCWCELGTAGHSDECMRNPTHLCHRHRTYYIEGWTR